MNGTIKPSAHQIRARDITNDCWGPWREATEAESHAVKNLSNWDARDLYAIEDLLENDALMDAIEASAWLHPDDAPLGEPVLVMLGVLDTFDRAALRADGLWYSSTGSQLLAGHVTAWRHIKAPTRQPQPLPRETDHG